MSIKYAILPAVIIGDFVSKRLYHFEETNHYITIAVWKIVIVLLFAVFASVKNRQNTFPMALIAAGSIMNYLDGLDGVIINPFAIVSFQFAVAFNIADVSIICGMLLILLHLIKTWKRKIMEYTRLDALWKNA